MGLHVLVCSWFAVLLVAYIFMIMFPIGVYLSRVVPSTKRIEALRGVVKSILVADPMTHWRIRLLTTMCLFSLDAIALFTSNTTALTTNTVLVMLFLLFTTLAVLHEGRHTLRLKKWLQGESIPNQMWKYYLPTVIAMTLPWVLPLLIDIPDPNYLTSNWSAIAGTIIGASSTVLALVVSVNFVLFELLRRSLSLEFQGEFFSQRTVRNQFSYFAISILTSLESYIVSPNADTSYFKQVGATSVYVSVLLFVTALYQLYPGLFRMLSHVRAAHIYVNHLVDRIRENDAMRLWQLQRAEQYAPEALHNPILQIRQVLTSANETQNRSIITTIVASCTERLCTMLPNVSHKRDWINSFIGIYREAYRGAVMVGDDYVLQAVIQAMEDIYSACFTSAASWDVIIELNEYLEEFVLGLVKEGRTHSFSRAGYMIGRVLKEKLSSLGEEEDFVERDVPRKYVSILGNALDLSGNMNSPQITLACVGVLHSIVWDILESKVSDKTSFPLIALIYLNIETYIKESGSRHLDATAISIGVNWHQLQAMVDRAPSYSIRVLEIAVRTFVHVMSSNKVPGSMAIGEFTSMVHHLTNRVTGDGASSDKLPTWETALGLMFAAAIRIAESIPKPMTEESARLYQDLYRRLQKLSPSSLRWKDQFQIVLGDVLKKFVDIEQANLILEKAQISYAPVRFREVEAEH